MKTAHRWSLYAIAALVTAVAMAWVDRSAEDTAAPISMSARAAASTMPADKPATSTGWTLPQRTFNMPTIDPFDLAEPAAPAAVPARAQVENTAPAAVTMAVPQLPYAYVGQWVENGVITAFLTTPQGLNVAAHLGSTIDGSYRVESIDPQGIEFKYLPLGAKQKLSFTQASAAVADNRAASPQTVTAPESEETN